MEILVGIVLILLAAFVVGAIARFAVPGPDPLPVSLTIVLGLVGAVVGAALFAGVGALLGGEAGGGEAPPPAAGDDEVAVAASVGMFFVAVVGATLVLVLYRKLVQKRPLTGPGAHRPTLRPRGLGRFLTRRPHRYVEDTADPESGFAPDQLRKLVLLREAGRIDEEEYERRKAALLEQL